MRSNSSYTFLSIVPWGGIYLLYFIAGPILMWVIGYPIIIVINSIVLSVILHILLSITKERAFFTTKRIVGVSFIATLAGDLYSVFLGSSITYSIMNSFYSSQVLRSMYTYDLLHDQLNYINQYLIPFIITFVIIFLFISKVKFGKSLFICSVSAIINSLPWIFLLPKLTK